MHLFTSFSRCFSSLGVLLLSSMSLRISASFDRQIFAHFCCCRCHHARFIIVVLDTVRVAAGVEHDRTCLFTLMWKSCTKVFFSLCSGCSSPCGRCFSSRSPASTSQPPLQPLEPQVQGVYVQSSWRLCSVRADTLRRLVFIMLLVVLLLSVSCAPSSSLFFRSSGGRCSGSRLPAVSSYSLSFLMSSLT